MRSIFNFQFSIFNHKTQKGFTAFSLYERGFTLVELLVSIIVLVAVGSIIAGAISSSLRGANKTNTIENIRQNGNYVLNQISKDIEFAQPFDGKNTGLSNDGSTYDTSCASALSPTPMPVTPYDYITIQSTGGVLTKYKCNSSELSANTVSLIDLNTMSLIGCSLSCIQNKPTDIPIIKINFTLGPKNPNSLMENTTSPITFETSVAIRNYGK